MNLRKAITCVLALSLLLASLGGAALASEFPIVQEPITLNFLTSRAAIQSDFSEMVTFTTYEEMTGIHINWIEAPANGLAEKRNLALASGDLPDVFYKTDMPVVDLARYGADGTFIPLNDLIEEHAPNIRAMFEKFPDIKEALTMLDGNIYSLPYAMEVISPRLANKHFINKEWLDAAGGTMPTTTDELYDTLMLMKEYDYNGNGEADERFIIAETFRGMIGSFAGAFGVANRSMAVGNYDEDPAEAGKVRYWPASDDFKAELQYLNKLHEAGLIDPEMITQQAGEYPAKASQGAAFNIFINNSTGGAYAGKYEGLTPLIGPNGHQQWAAILPTARNIGAFVVTSANQYPVETIKWVDYFFSEEGSLLYFMGIEGETFRMNDEGTKYVYLDDIANDPGGLTFDQSVGRYVPWAGVGGPSLATYEVFSGAAVNDISQAAADKIEPYAVDYWLALKFTEEENEEVIALEAQLNPYVDQMAAEFVTGRKSFDEWDAYVDMMYQMGLEELLEYVQAAVDRMP